MAQDLFRSGERDDEMNFKNIAGFFGAATIALFLCPFAQGDSGHIVVDAYLPIPSPVAYSSTFSVRADGINWASAQVVMTTVTQTGQVFTDGQAATATWTVNSYTALSTGVASGQLTAVSTQAAIGVAGSAQVAVSSNVSGTQISILGPPGSLNFMVGGNVAPGYSSTSTAVNFMTAVIASSVTSAMTASVNASSTVVTVTCLNAGTFCNAYSVTSSSVTAISTAAFSGGVNPVVVTVGFAQLMAVRDFQVGATTATMASNLAALIYASSPTLTITASTTATNGLTGIIYTTSTIPGTVGNSIPLISSNQLAISTATNFMTGGTNDAQVCIGAVCWTANNQWAPATSNNQTATNLATAINASSNTTGVVAAAAGAIVSATSTVVGTGPNSYIITSSTNNALTVAVLVSSNPTTGTAVGTFAGGLNAAWTINTSAIALPGNNFGLGQGVFLTTSSAVGLSPLTWGTTVYIITNSALGTGNVELATSLANALAGTAIVLTSSGTPTTQDKFTLNPSSAAISGTPSMQWVVSNDNTHWLPYTTTPFNITIPSVSYGVYYSTGTVNNFDFGHMDYSYLGISVNAPTTGAINLGAHVIGNAP